jgi:hypothetical protein
MPTLDHCPICGKPLGACEPQNDIERITQAFQKRLTIYQDKQALADYRDPDQYNRHEALRYVIEAIDLLAFEAGIKIPDAEGEVGDD